VREENLEQFAAEQNLELSDEDELTGAEKDDFVLLTSVMRIVFYFLYFLYFILFFSILLFKNIIRNKIRSNI
jgi:hypothetical protein